MQTAIIDHDRELVERARVGEQPALARLTDAYKDRVFALINRMLDDPGRSEELTYEAFIRAFKNLGSFRGDAKFSSWLYRIALNLALAERAKKRLEQVSLSEHEYLAADQASHPDQVYQSLFCSRVIEEALAQLPIHYATALRLFYLRGVGYVEIAEVMKIPIGTVKTYLHRGKRALKEIVTGKYRPEELL
ncbi:MAG: sigma-70 family RNA polymerase sigma factor [candidate division Zixibacteria bacterium]|nr:sigma-70 family RNA polymerase sigma factor [candidate division Zixibacteria bacterium]